MLIPFKELFDRYNIKPTGIIHLGANEGQEAEEYIKLGVRNILWIEAVTEVYFRLIKRLERFNSVKHFAWNVCLSDTDFQNVIFHVANNGGQSSSFLELGTHKTAHPEVKYIQDKIMITRRLDSLITEALNIPEFKNVFHTFNFLNIDLQGAELLALKGMGDYLNQIKYAYIEVNKDNLYLGCPMIEEIDHHLSSFGLTRVETKWTNWNWGDAFYIKK